MLKFKQYILEGIGANVQGSPYTAPSKRNSLFTAMMNSLPHITNIMTNSHKLRMGYNIESDPEDHNVFHNYLKQHIHGHVSNSSVDPKQFENFVKHLGVIPVQLDSNSPVHKFHIVSAPYTGNAGGMYHGRSGATHHHHTGEHHHLITVNSSNPLWHTDPYHAKSILTHELTHGLQHITGLGHSGSLDSWGYRGSRRKGTMRYISSTPQEPDTAPAPKRQRRARKKIATYAPPDSNSLQSDYLHAGLETNARMFANLHDLSRQVQQFHLNHGYESHIKNASEQIEAKAKGFNSEAARQKHRQTEYRKLFDERSKHFHDQFDPQIKQLDKTIEPDQSLVSRTIIAKPIKLRQQKLREKQKRNRILMYKAVHDHHLNDLIRKHSGGHDVLEYDTFNHTARREQKRKEKEKRRTKDRERKQRKQTANTPTQEEPASTATQATTKRPIIFGQSDDARMHSRDHQNKIIDNIIKVKDENEMKQREEQKPKPGRIRRAIDTVKRVLGRVVGRE